MTIIKKIKDYLYHLLNLIKRYINRYRTDNEITVNEGLFNSLIPGDIVWSKMPLDDISLAKVKPGHRVRPYVFLKRKKDSFWGLYCSSSATVKKEIETYHLWGGDRYGLSKISYIRLSPIEIIPRENIISYMTRLKDADMSIINKKLDILKHNHHVETKFRFDVKMAPLAGDVISFKHKRYYIFDSDKTNIKAFRIYNDASKCNKPYILDNSRHLYIDLDKMVNLKDDQGFKYVDMLNHSFNEELTKRLKTKIKKPDIKIKTKTENEDPYWLYQEGQILLNKYYEEDFLYLYSFKNRHYGLNLKRYNLNRIKDYDEVIYLEKRRWISHLKTGNVLKGDDLAEVETLLYENDDEFILEPPTFKRLI